MSDYPIPQNTKKASSSIKLEEADVAFNDALAQNAFTALLNAIKGNGLTPQKVTLKNTDAHVYNVYSALHLKASPKISHRDLPGAVNEGEMISPGQINNKIEQILQDFAYDTSLQQAVIRDITQNPHKGFGLKAADIKLPVSKTFIEQENCVKCQGQGRSPCNTCQGSGKMPCNKCRGNRLCPCVMCQGTGRVQTAGSNDFCTYCKGQGQMPCDMCRSAGYIPCTSCGQAGILTCQTCNGSGKQTRQTTVDFILNTAFELMDAGFTPSLKSFMAGRLEGIAANKEIDVQQIPPEDIEPLVKERKLPPANKSDFAYIAYRALCPHARLTISFAGKKDISLTMAGYKSRIIKSDNFLDILMNKPMKLLQNAAANGRTTTTNILKAAQWKTAKHAILAAINNAPKKASAALLKETPLGLSEKYAKGLTYYAYLAIKNITRLPRYMALGIGSFLSIGFYKLWYDQNRFGAAELANDIAPPHISGLGSDIFCAVFMIILQIFFIRFAGALTLQKTLSQLGISKSGKKWPKAGKTSVYAIILQFIALGIAAAFLTTKKPEWLGLIGL